MITLSLRPTTFNHGQPVPNDYVVYWRSPQFGRRVVGRIHQAYGRPAGSPLWTWSITVPIAAIHYGRGSVETIDQAKERFRKAFERFEAETPDRAFARLYASVGCMRDRQQKAAWTAKFDDPIPLPEGGSIKTLSEARRYMLTLSEREQMEQRWQDAANYVLKSIEQRGYMFFARSSIYKAIHRIDNEVPSAPRVKKPDIWRERRRARRVTAQ
jgi:hypothetical protein